MEEVVVAGPRVGDRRVEDRQGADLMAAEAEDPVRQADPAGTVQAVAVVATVRQAAVIALDLPVRAHTVRRAPA